ncbi:MAG: glycoside hydrolase family 127 protein [Planctomycetota bacterium]|nr:glycoside hydrolase family 127 protein [Planctomycetota bacterium]
MLLTPLTALHAATADTIDAVARPDASQKNKFYAGNREPLLPSPLLKLPIGAIRPRGWLRKQLELEADGFFGHLPELSRFLIKEGNPWLSPDGEGEKFWEEVPYWLKGFGDLAYTLGDETLIAEAKVWINGVIGTQREDGWFGARANIKSPRVHSTGKPDLWPNMAMLNALQAYHEYSGDERVIRLMTKYFEWQLTVPDEDFLPPLWQKQRAGDNLASVYWLYNRTGDKQLLDLAQKIFGRMDRWTEGVPNWHNVNIAQALRGTPTYYLQSKNAEHLLAAERNYQTVWGEYGQVPGGMFGGDEGCRPGFVTARQAVETCGIVEMMHSCEELLKIDADLQWADRCEDVAFNSLPATTTPDFRALRYLTAPNLVISNSKNKSPKIQDPGAKYQMNPHGHRCCQLNMGQGWPYYAEHLWMATPDSGLALGFYSDSTVTARVGSGTEVIITEVTHYPFDENIVLTVSLPQSQEFPLYLRIPQWCARAELSINDQPVKVESKPQTFLRINRGWKDGDVVKLKLPMPLSVRTWTKNANTVSIDRGPLTYSLKIAERYVPIAGAIATSKEYLPDAWRRELSAELLAAWPAFEIYPATPWNYGLILDQSQLDASCEVARKPWPADNSVWQAAAAPIELKAKGRKIPEWKADETDLVGLIADGPVKSAAPVEELTLIPMGAARLRLSAFPVIDNGPVGRVWAAPAEPFVKITPRQAAAMKKAAAGEQDLDALNPPTKKTPKGAAAQGANPQGVAPKGPTAEDRAKTFDRWDTNRDGVVTLAEYLAGQKPNDLLEARFKRLDRNGDGQLTREEFIRPSAK